MSIELINTNDNINNLKKIGLFNSNLLTCQESNNDIGKCMRCTSCKVVILDGICGSLISHLSHYEVIEFIEMCINHNELNMLIGSYLEPLLSKDRIYMQCRITPGLDTDVFDLGMKNFAVNKEDLNETLQQISLWIKKQPVEFRTKFLCIFLSKLKVSVLAELYKRSKKTLESVQMTNESKKEDLSDRVVSRLFQRVKNLKEHRSDFICNLPVHISKYILNLLDEKSLRCCALVNIKWKQIVNQVRREDIVNQKIKEQAMLLQAVSSIPADPNYAKDVDIPIPVTKKHSYAVLSKDLIGDYKVERKPFNFALAHSDSNISILGTRTVFNMELAYKNIITNNVIVEERNVYCGAYSVFMVINGHPRDSGIVRNIGYSGGPLLVMGLGKSIQFADVEGKINATTKLHIHAHTGTVHVVKFIHNVDNINDKSGQSQVLSGSYDTTIRRWDVATGKCLMIYIGHMSSVTCLAVSDREFISGSQDGTCRIWKYKERKCIHKLRHLNPVTAVALSTQLCISGDNSGLIKVWNINDGTFIKNLTGHTRGITSLRIDSFHILSGSKDCFVYMWSAVGNFSERIASLRHPKPVLDLEFLYLRAITAAEDGRIRIWNVRNGQCIRLLRGNSKSDPILNMIICADRIVVNTQSNVLALNFESIVWKYDYSTEDDQRQQQRTFKSLTNIQQNFISQDSSVKSPNIHHQRHQRSRFAGNLDPRIFMRSNLELEKLTDSQPDLELSINRSNTLLVSPSLSKSYLKAPSRVLSKETECSASQKAEVVNPESSNAKKVTSKSRVASARRLSYGFENPDREDIVPVDSRKVVPVDKQKEVGELKKTLRRHIRSEPDQAAAAMPNYVKLMLDQVHSSAQTGRAISGNARQALRRFSGPVEINMQDTVSTNEIRRKLSTETTNKPMLVESTNQRRVQSANILLQRSNELCSAQFSTSFKYQCDDGEIKVPLAKITLPDNFREKLVQQRKQLERQRIGKEKEAHNLALQQQPKTNRRNRSTNVPVVVNLGLKTMESIDKQLRDLDDQQTKYYNQLENIEQQAKFQKWVEKAQKPPTMKYERDAIMKRPKSAKI